MKQKGMSVAIIGGGIGGLSAALSLLRAGVDAHVYEQTGRVTGGDCVSTLAIASPFAPLHRRIQALIDRRFYRHRYDAE